MTWTCHLGRWCAIGVMLFTVMLWGGRARAADAAAVCDTYSNKILEQLKNQQPLNAIETSADFEEALIALYPPSRFELGLYTSEAYHLSLHSPFTDWTLDDQAAKQFPSWLPSMGFELLFAFKGKMEGEMLLAFAFDIGKIEQRIAGAAMGKTTISDEELQMMTQMIVGQFGVVKGQQVKTIGDHRVTYIEVGPMGIGSPMVLANLTRGRQMYGFLLVTPTGNRPDNEKKLAELITTTDLNYKPANAAAIAAVEKKITDTDNVEQALTAIRELARIGEYGAAAQQLTRLRTLIADRMPKPTVVGNTARYPGYEIVMQNPDPEKWKLSVEAQGGMGMMMLEDKFSVSPAGILVGVINTIIAYGPKAAKALLNEMNEDEKKAMLSNAGRGGLLNIGTEVVEERFRPFRGTLAYEGVATTNIPGTKVKAIIFEKGTAFIMVILMASTANFDAAMQQYEAIIEKNISFGGK